jgi:hypothetical protein
MMPAADVADVAADRPDSVGTVCGVPVCTVCGVPLD